MLWDGFRCVYVTNMAALRPPLRGGRDVVDLCDVFCVYVMLMAAGCRRYGVGAMLLIYALFSCVYVMLMAAGCRRVSLRIDRNLIYVYNDGRRRTVSAGAPFL